MVEFALVSLLLVLLVFGIINFGLILSFKQDVTRAAAEGARVGAVAPPPAAAPASQPFDSRYIATLDATEEAVASFGHTCGAGGMSCTVALHDCGTDPDPSSVAYYATPTQDCVTVSLSFDYENHPILAEPPVVARFMPDAIEATSVARVNQ